MNLRRYWREIVQISFSFFRIPKMWQHYTKQTQSFRAYEHKFVNSDICFYCEVQVLVAVIIFEKEMEYKTQILLQKYAKYNLYIRLL